VRWGSEAIRRDPSYATPCCHEYNPGRFEWPMVPIAKDSWPSWRGAFDARLFLPHGGWRQGQARSPARLPARTSTTKSADAVAGVTLSAKCESSMARGNVRDLTVHACNRVATVPTIVSPKDTDLVAAPLRCNYSKRPISLAGGGLAARSRLNRPRCLILAYRVRARLLGTYLVLPLALVNIISATLGTL